MSIREILLRIRDYPVLKARVESLETEIENYKALNAVLKHNLKARNTRIATLEYHNMRFKRRMCELHDNYENVSCIESRKNYT